MFQTIKFTLTVLTIFGSSLCIASDISVGEKVNLFSNVLNEARELWIYKPQNYDAVHHHQ